MQSKDVFGVQTRKDLTQVLRRAVEGKVSAGRGKLAQAGTIIAVHLCVLTAGQNLS